MLNRLATCSVKRSISIRNFSNTRTVFDKKTDNAKDKKIDIESINKELLKLEKESSYKLDDNSLIHRPDLWKGLPSELVSRLYKARVISYGKSYKKSSEELDAILDTATNPLETQLLYKIYNSTEADVFRADTETDYDNYLTEGEYMEDPLEPYGFDEYPASAQNIVRDFRDHMEFNRKAAFELPQLAKFRQEYKHEDECEKPVLLKYTRFLGESHPGERKVVLQLKVDNLKLPNDSNHKFKLLAGQRYDHNTDLFLISCDKFLEPAQNASYLSEILDNLIAESKKNPEEFIDVPLDERHTIAKYNKKQRKNHKIIPFPKEWEKPITQGERKVNLNQIVSIDSNAGKKDIFN